MAIACISFVSAADSLLDPSSAGFGGRTRGQNYDELVDALFANKNVVTTIGDKMWVPWYKRSDSCGVSDLQSGNACNAGTIDATHNCMVTDEFSQVGVLVSMGTNQQRMDQFYNTVIATKSTNGVIPAWRIYRNGDQIEPCKQGINGNCDTASDATARIIISLFTAAKNPSFSSEAKTKYLSLAKTMSSDFIKYEVDQTCRPTKFGNVCYWLAAGSNARRGGMASTDYAYTGYYADGIIAMLMACQSTGNTLYCNVAKDFSHNYLQAAKYDGSKFTAPPGRSYKWVSTDTNPTASCTNTCNPDRWDSADAPRALGTCQALYYSKKMGYSMPQLEKYCAQWESQHLKDPNRVAIMYSPDGSAYGGTQSGYFAQGLQSLALTSSSDKTLYTQALDSALRHYSPTGKTWDGGSCFGIYMQAFAVRSLGTGLGRDLGSFTSVQQPPVQTTPPATGGQPGTTPTAPTQPTVPTKPQPTVPTAPTTPTTPTAPTVPTTPTAPTQPTVPTSPQPSIVSTLKYTCTAAGAGCTVVSDVTSGVCRTIRFSTVAGDLQVLSCEKDAGYVELYRQQAPEVEFKVCLDVGCIDRNSGFARFIPGKAPTAPPATQVPTQPSQPVEPTAPQAPSPTSSMIGDMPYTCTVNGVPCTISQDVTEGVCRTIRFSTEAGLGQVLACEKDGGNYELYRQDWPEGTDFSFCLSTGCVDEVGGYVRFTPAQSDLREQEPEPAPSAPESPAPVELAKISSLAYTCDAEGVSCSVKSDETYGTCRTIKFGSVKGDIQVLGCEKDAGFAELYKQAAPDAEIKVCLGSGCVDKNGGYSRFKLE